MKDVLVSLRKVKQEIAVETIPKADMWCHFGKITIQIPDRGSVSLCFAVNCQLTSPRHYFTQFVLSDAHLEKRFDSQSTDRFLSVFFLQRMLEVDSGALERPQKGLNT